MQGRISNYFWVFNLSIAFAALKEWVSRYLDENHFYLKAYPTITSCVYILSVGVCSSATLVDHIILCCVVFVKRRTL